MGKIKEILVQYKNCFNKRDENIWVFGSWNGEKYADNPKYLYLDCLKKENLKCYWITKNINVYTYLKNKGYPVEMYDSPNGIAIQKKAGCAIYCLSVNDLNEKYIGGAKLINLWHGIPLKKIGYDDQISRDNQNFRVLLRKALRWFPYRNTYIVSTSPTFTNIYQSAFKKNKEHIIELGQPRNDMFFDPHYVNDFDFKKFSNKRIITYMPTHRNEGKTKINLNEIFDLHELNDLCIKANSIFIIKKHFYHRDESYNMEQYSNIVDLTNTDIDAQELLKNTDILVTDYSSCYIDFLLLKRPIIFYNYDLNNYLINDREMYFEYDKVTPGVKIIDKEGFYRTLCALLLENKDAYEDSRLQALKLFYDNRTYSIGNDLIEIIKDI